MIVFFGDFVFFKYNIWYKYIHIEIHHPVMICNAQINPRKLHISLVPSWPPDLQVAHHSEVDLMNVPEAQPFFKRNHSKDLKFHPWVLNGTSGNLTWNMREPTKNGGWEDDFPFWLSNFFRFHLHLFQGVKNLMTWRSLWCQLPCRNLLAGHEASSWRHCGASDLNFSHPQNTDLKCNVGAWKMMVGRFLFLFKMLTFFLSYTPEVYHGTWKSANGKRRFGTWKPSFSSSILNFRSYHPPKTNMSTENPPLEDVVSYWNWDIPMSC